MSQLDLLRFTVALLNSLDIAYMLVGSHASSFYGEARSTHDIDLVVELDTKKGGLLLTKVPPDRYYLSESALREGRMAKLIDTFTGDKVDMFFLDDDIANRTAFARRAVRSVMGIDVPLASAEDTILAKLKWSLMSGGSERQLADIRQIMNIQQARLDVNYLREQAVAMGLARELNEQERAIWGDE